jgi:outer membrane protein TolC
MVCIHRRAAVAALFLLLSLGGSGCNHYLPTVVDVFSEQRTLAIREPEQLPQARIPDVPPPATVSDPQPNLPERYLSLNEAIKITVANSKVVRVLAGATAVSSGQTIYDAAITNTTIDQQKAAFDPTLQVKNNFNRRNEPTAVFNPLSPTDTSITGIRNDEYALDTSLSKKTITGATVSVDFMDTLDQFHPGVFPLNPQNTRATTLSVTQPLLQGGGVEANMVPIVVARINTERSYYQFKDSMQEEIRGVVAAYWQLVFARTDVWARQQQVKLGQFQYDYNLAKFNKGLGNAADVAQAKSALANFKAQLVVSQANMFQQEDALRNIMGLPPTDGTRLVPTSPPSMTQKAVHWKELIRLAEQRRPDLINLKLQIQTDQQLLVQANNQALPKVDAVALYRFNGLSGTTPTGAHIGTDAGQYTDYTLGVNVSLPLGLRQGRALLRQQQLTLSRDWANLDQGLHAAIHELSTTTRSMSQDFEQYKALEEARVAALENLRVQDARFRSGNVPNFTFLNVLQAISDWGNSVSAAAQALAQYNTDLATIERQTGTILETHGIQFFEERYPAIGPCGRLARPKLYPESTPPAGPDHDSYPVSNQPAENIFDLKVPTPLLEPGLPRREAQPEQLPNPATLGPATSGGANPLAPRLDAPEERRNQP